MPVPLGAADFALRLALAGVLFYASADKILHPQDFAALVKGYHVLPEALLNPVAVWLPWLELALGLCLFSGFWSEGAAMLTAGLFGVFWLLLIVSFFRGIDVACGCFSTRPADPGEPVSMLFYIGRDAVLLGLALLTAWVRVKVVGEGGG
ncbi:MAG: DoxX family membrane protein [Proteobacteria bacterium]|nr:DoxX family membrane protein [Pseudomonadota bacterium]MBU1594492.1 DoxX family membrane protein [Pseudomonadota bacterium]